MVRAPAGSPAGSPADRRGRQRSPDALAVSIASSGPCRRRRSAGRPSDPVCVPAVFFLRRVCAAGYDDTGHRDSGGCRIFLQRRVRERDHAHQALVAIEDRQPPDLDVTLSSSSKQYLTSLVITSRTVALPSSPSATARTTMSRSVIVPTSRSVVERDWSGRRVESLRPVALRRSLGGLVLR